MHGEVEVRPEIPADEATVERVVTAAFGQDAEAQLVAALRRRAAPVLSLVAVADGAVVGHVMLSPVEVEPAIAAAGRRATPAVATAGLAPVAVDPAHQRRGVGAALVGEALARAPALGWRAIFVVGDPAYYGRFGFEAAAPRGLHYHPDCDAAFQVLELDPGVLTGHTGRVAYHAAFDELGEPPESS
ncbi:MAG: N-acetyltransferase [Planctomycetota bacterium]